MTLIDLYSEKYIGELETVLIEKNFSDQIINELRLASGEFTSVIDWIPFNLSSNHNSLIYILNVDLHWGTEFSQVFRLQELYDQLLLISNDVHSFHVPVLNAIKAICLSTLQNNNNLFIKLNS